MVGVVVLLKVKRLPMQGAADVFLLSFEPLNLGVVLAPRVANGSGQVESKQAQPFGPEDAPTHEVDDLLEAVNRCGRAAELCAGASGIDA
jgi:hypothetical protein